MFYKLVNKFLLLIDSISVAFGFISGSFSFLLGYKLALFSSLRNEKYPRNTLQNRLELIYRTYLFGVQTFLVAECLLVAQCCICTLVEVVC